MSTRLAAPVFKSLKTQRTREIVLCQSIHLPESVHDRNTVRTLVNVALFNPLTDDKILDWSKFQQIADGILKCI